MRWDYLLRVTFCAAFVLTSALAAAADVAATPTKSASPAADSNVEASTSSATELESGDAAAPAKVLPLPAAANATLAVDAKKLSSTVLIFRDSYGVPHIDAVTDAGAIFGFAYAQAEDYFWQIEDNYILAIGRYSEVHGPKGLNSDLLNRSFEIVREAQADFHKLTPSDQYLCAAFVAGLNYYLEKTRTLSRG
jgi:acyl-homoserine lactone acylase PvdQ